MDCDPYYMNDGTCTKPGCPNERTTGTCDTYRGEYGRRLMHVVGVSMQAK